MAYKKNAHLLANILEYFAVKSGRKCIKGVPCVMPNDTVVEIISDFDPIDIGKGLLKHLKIVMNTKYKLSTKKLGEDTTLLDICDLLVEAK